MHHGVELGLRFKTNAGDVWHGDIAINHRRVVGKAAKRLKHIVGALGSPITLHVKP